MVDDTYERFIKSMSTEDFAEVIVNDDILRMCCDDTGKDCDGKCVKCLSRYLKKKIS